jgi:peptide/nickel transport system substrate-binding protein
MTKANITLFTNADPVTCGPFKLTSWTKGASIVLDANKNYWDGAPYIARAVFQLFANSETMVNALRNNEIDIIPKELPPTSIGLLSSDLNIKVATATDLYYRHIVINMWDQGKGNPTLRDVNVRDALAMATDKQALINIVQMGYNTPGSTIVMKAASYWWNPEQLFPFNISAANALLNSSGYLDIDDDGIRESPNGSVEMSYTLLILSRWPEEMRTGQQLQTWWAQIGVKLTPQSAASNTILSLVFPDYSQDMYLWGFSGATDPSFSLSIYLTDQVQNWNGAGYANATYDALYDEQVRTMDPEARKLIVYQMQDMIYRASPSIVLYYMDAMGAYRLDKFTGFVNMPVGLISTVNPYTLRQVHLIYAESTEPAGTDYVPWAIAGVGIAIAVGAVAYVFMKKPKAPKT